MIQTITVLLYGKPIGALRLLENGYCDFEYNDAFRASGLQPSPLMMPTNGRRVYSFPNLSRDTFNGLPGMVADSLPDSFGQALLNQWLTLHSRDEGQANALEKLSFQGQRCMGALEYQPARETYMDESTLIELDSMVETARQALASKEGFKACLENNEQAILEILKIGTSAGGQRAKAVIALNDTTKEIRSGQVPAPDGFDYWLLKFDGFDSNAHPVNPANYGRIEYAFSRCVQDAGIEMPECRLIHENGRAHFMTKRFDRKNGQKIHMQTLCGLAHYDFQRPGAYSYEQVFRTMRLMNLDYVQGEEMFRRMLFNILSVNMDDHTKNISFLMERNGIWRLSPAYDMGFSYNPNGQWANVHQLSINGKRDNITNKDILEVASSQSIKHPEVILEHVDEAVSHFEKYASEEGVPSNEVKHITGIIKQKRDSLFPSKIYPVRS